ncbi:hypothetical protein HNR46_003824 [Haloferula luteola]|uniref:Uncharacterized protein n=1 Tax=Haloferula luteola TaxID=595692 RepID=A0A840V785_9BACT|nr:hypothetical protein [Haloferula luteola]MBB5353563.1 hypothetical protein [Haloferula luteola]
MKIKLFFVTLATLSVASCEENAHPCKFTVKVVDDQEMPVSNATVGVSTFLKWEPGQGFGEDIYDTEKSLSDLTGEASFSFQSKTGKIGIGVDAGDDYYRSNWPHYKFKQVVSGRWIPENPTIPYVLKRKRDPIPLYAKTYIINHTTIPKKNEKCGYDLEKGDWIAPHGKGVTPDIVFNLEVNRDNGVYDNDCTLKVAFSNEGDGLISSPKPLNEGSELRLDYLAPEKGYKPTLSMTASTDLADKVRHDGFERTRNYYLRVRTKLDEDGELIRANYAKVHGDFEFWYTGDMRFTYYFNPTPNDRNLEFDPSKNLFQNLEDAMRVSDP